MNNLALAGSSTQEKAASHFDILIERLLAKEAAERYVDIEQTLLNLEEFGKTL